MASNNCKQIHLSCNNSLRFHLIIFNLSYQLIILLCYLKQEDNTKGAKRSSPSIKTKEKESISQLVSRLTKLLGIRCSRPLTLSPGKAETPISSASPRSQIPTATTIPNLISSSRSTGDRPSIRPSSKGSQAKSKIRITLLISRHLTQNA